MIENWLVVLDILWTQPERLLPGKASDSGATAKYNALFLEVVFYHVRTESPWGDLLRYFGN